MSMNEDEVLGMVIGATTTIITCGIVVLERYKRMIRKRKSLDVEFIPREPNIHRRHIRESYINSILYCGDTHCLGQIRMRPMAFFRLCDILIQKGLLKESIQITVREQVLTFLHLIGHNVRFRVVGGRFHRSSWTVHRYFHIVLQAILKLYEDVVRLPSLTTSPEIRDNPRFYPWFEDCIGAIDGTHARASVPIHMQGRFRGRKGGTTQNVLAAVSFDKRFTYVLAGWEGSAHDSRILNDALSRPRGLQVPEELGHQEHLHIQRMREEEVNRCQIQEWYPKFKSVSMNTIIHKLPESFVQYLLEDSGPFLLPVSISNEDALPNRVHKPEDEEDYQVSEGSGDESEQSPPPPSFPELELKIKDSIESLGGAVFPKLNWTSPKDAAWISPTGSLKCTSFSDIALLLRSSDSTVHDLCHAYDSCSDKSSSRPKNFYLALRKWYPSLRPEMEFRCFVQGHLLVGVSQREVTSYYPVLLESKDELKTLICEFFVSKVKGRFESENYTFDIYVTKDQRVKLMDFNPWGAFTLPLLFTWEELEQSTRRENVSIDFRIVESRCGVRPGLKTAVPFDYIDASPGSGWDQFLRNAGEELCRQTRSSEAGA